MSIQTTDLFDATHANIAHLPAGHVAGYVTGSGGVPWTDADWAAHPGAVRIAQSPIVSVDESPRPDVIDLEAGAVTLGEAATLIKAEQAAYKAAERPGQRWPAIYCSRSVVTPVVNALIAGGVLSCPLAVADYNNNRAAAAAEVANASGPFPIVWRQYADTGGGGTFDLGVASVPWLSTVSAKPQAVIPQTPPGQWRDPHAWTWQQAAIAGVGLDGKTYQFTYNPVTGGWDRA